jgi:hypothetical protein
MIWSDLDRRARAFRVFHGTWSVLGLASLVYLWVCAATGRRDRWLGAGVTFLSVEGVGLLIGRGDCPLGPFQRQLGDSKPFFELVLPPRAAKAAVPVLAVASITGIALVAARALGTGAGRLRSAQNMDGPQAEVAHDHED